MKKPRLSSYWRNLFRRRRLENELDQEVRAYVDMAKSEKIAAGMSPADARRAALIEFGGVEQVKEEVRAVRAGALLEQVWQDLRYGARMLRKNPGFTAVAVLTIALGIGVNAAIFAIVESTTLQPLHVPGSKQVVGVYQIFVGPSDRNVHGSSTMFSYPEYLEYRERNHVFSGLMAYAPFVEGTISGYSQQLYGALTTCNYFDVLQARVALGRGFVASDCAVEGANGTVVLSQDLWRRAFGADAGILGRTIRLNRQPLTVVGVAAENFHGTEPAAADFWVPVTMQRAIAAAGSDSRGYLHEDNLSWLVMLGRLREGVGLSEARSDLGVIAAQVDRRHPGRKTRLAVTVATFFGDPEQSMVATAVSTVILVAVGLVLLIACANVANLMLSRAIQRRKEIAIRLALGAARGRVVRQLLTESLLVALMGGALGLVVAVWASKAALSMILAQLPPGVPQIVLSVQPDFRLFLYGLALSVGTAIAFGLLPALQATRTDTNRELKLEASQSDVSHRGRLRSTFLGVQVAVSMVLLIAAGLLLRALYRTQSVETGFDNDHTALASFNLRSAGYDAARATALHRDARQRLRALPGVDAVASTLMTPLNGSRRQSPFTAEGQSQHRQLDYNGVSPEYFSIIGIPIVRGRTFLPSDEGGQAVAIVSESAAHLFWPGADPIGKRISGYGVTAPAEVIGVAKDTDVVRPGTASLPVIYFPLTPDDMLHARLLVHTQSRYSAIAQPVVNTLHELDPDLLVQVAPIEDNLRVFIAPSRIAAAIAGTFGGLGLLLACVGIYGTVSYNVSRRTREIGIRMTLGARAADVLRLILRGSMRPVVIGAAVGIVLCAAVSRVLRVILFGVSPLDAIAYVSVAAFLLAVALLASYVPARRAVRVDPMVALRHE